MARKRSLQTTAAVREPLVGYVEVKRAARKLLASYEKGRVLPLSARRRCELREKFEILAVTMMVFWYNRGMPQNIFFDLDDKWHVERVRVSYRGANPNRRNRRGEVE